MTGDESAPRTLYVGNLSPLVSEELLITLFGQIGECKSCKIIHEPGNDPYAFIEFSDHSSANNALSAMNKRNCLGKEMKVNWATTSGHQAKVDASNHYHIFVGDLAPEIESTTLREAFAPFGDISDVKIMKDPHTLQHKGYGFISFVNKVDAETAIASMNGQWLGTRKIRTNWATRKVQPGGEMMTQSSMGLPTKYVQKLDYNEVWARSSDNNTTVYCGGVNGLSEDIVRNTFQPFGPVLAIHTFPDRGYAFVRFASKEAACNAICGVHGLEVNGGLVKCSWGKENIDITSQTTPGLGSSASFNTNITSLQASAAASNQGGNVWATAANPSWATNYQWPGAYAPNNNAAAAMNYWQQYPGYQNTMMQQGWGVMPTATTANSQYQMNQNPQGYNAKS